MIEADDLTIAKLCMRGRGAAWWATFRSEEEAREATGVPR